jgi:hypothetical protein
MILKFTRAVFGRTACSGERESEQNSAQPQKFPCEFEFRISGNRSMDTAEI